MNTQSLRLLTLVVSLFAISPAVLSAAEPAKEDAAFASKLITAVEKADYDAFVADGEAPFKQLTKEQFAAVAAQLAPKFKVGYEVSYLGDLKAKGYRVTLWKIALKSGEDDLLVTLAMRDGKVGGFFIK